MPSVQQVGERSARLVGKGEPHGQAPEVQGSLGGGEWSEALRAPTQV